MTDNFGSFSIRRLWTWGVEKEESPAAQERPWHLARKRAVIAPWFPLRTRDKIFPLSAIGEVTRYAANIIAGPTAPLIALADQICNGAPAPEAKIAVILFLRPGQQAITNSERDLLWKAFRTPVYQEYRGLDGGLLAWECEVQSGFHIPESIRSTAVPGTLVTEPCACGLDAPRLVSRPDTVVNPIRVLATTA